jgi:hypothetical protein
VLRIRIPASCAFLTPCSSIRIQDPGLTFQKINFPDYISESLVTIIWVRNTEILCKFGVADRDPGSVAFFTLDFGSATLLVVKTFLLQGNIDIGLAKRLYKDLSDARCLIYQKLLYFYYHINGIDWKFSPLISHFS